MPRRVFIFLFFALALLPLAQMTFHFAPVPAVDENRALATPPSRTTPPAQWPRVAERWFADHFGLRSLLITLKTEIDYRLFGTSDRVLVGSDGQLFYRSVVNVQEPAVERFLAAQEDTLLRNIGAFGAAAERAGVHVVLMLNLMSDRFYPERLPRAALPRPAAPRIDSFYRRLQTLPGIEFLDSTAILRAAMVERPIFHRTDFHWNEPAAFAVARTLVERISTADGRAQSAWTHDLVIETRAYSGGIARFMPLLSPPVEQALFVRPSWQWPAGYAEATYQSIFHEVTRADPDPRLLPPIVLLGDSFLDAVMASGLAADFQATYRKRWDDEMKLSDFARYLPDDARWLVVQFIEVNEAALRAFANSEDVDLAVRILDHRRR
jgi:hypothetical protein